MRKALALVLFICCGAGAQQTIRIGQAVVPLTGPWKFHIGDSPRWADPDFDDSTWETVYLSGSSDYVPGWTTMGHPGYAGYAWYRSKVQIDPTKVSLSLLMPLEVDDGYEIYVNGREIGHFGDLTRRKPAVYSSTAKWFAMPASAPEQTTILAVRFYMDPATLVGQSDVGGMYAPPQLGAAGNISELCTLSKQRDWINGASFLLELVVFVGFAAALVMLYWLDPSETVYLWFSLGYLCLTFWALLTLVQRMPFRTELWSVADVFSAFYVGLLLTAWWRWFELKEKRWLIRLVWIFILIKIFAKLCADPPLFGATVPIYWLSGLRFTINSCRFAIALCLVVIVLLGVKRLGREGWLAVPAVLIFLIDLFASELLRLHIPMLWTKFGVQFTLDQIADVALSAVLGILIIRRFQRSQRRKQQLEADLRQAQQVQQVLLPQEIPALPGFRIECEYRPAQEVGGDFSRCSKRATGALWSS